VGEDVDISATLICAESVSENLRVRAKYPELKNRLGKGFAFERSEKSQNLTPPSIPENNKREYESKKYNNKRAN